MSARFRSFPLHSTSENKLFHCGLPRPYSFCCLYYACKRVTLPSLFTFSFTEFPVPSSIPNIYLYSPLQIPTPKARHNSHPQSRCSPLPFSSWPLAPLSGEKVLILPEDTMRITSLTSRWNSAQFIPDYMTSAAPCPTPVTRAPRSCYTRTLTLQDPRIRCAGFDTATCVPWECLRAETETIPCHKQGCPKTSTITTFSGCQTACSSGCPTVTVSCSSLLG
jgi:hypothetical protein